MYILLLTAVVGFAVYSHVDSFAVVCLFVSLLLTLPFVLLNSPRGQDLDYQTDPVSVKLATDMKASDSSTTLTLAADGNGTLVHL